MSLKHASRAFLTLAMFTLVAHAQTSSSGSQPGTTAQASGQAAASANPSAVSATGQASGTVQSGSDAARAGGGASGQATGVAQRDRGASSQAGNTTQAAGGAGQSGGGTALASGSSMNAVLTKPVDSGHSKPGDPVKARTTQAGTTESGASIPKGSELWGHVSEVHARGDGSADSAVGIVFDKAVTRDGREIPLRNVAIQAVAAAESSASADGLGMMSASGGGMGGARGGGLVGHAAGGVGAMVGSGAGAASSVTGSLGATGGRVLSGSPGSSGSASASGLLATNSTGVFGMRELNLSSQSTGGATGSVVTSSGRSVHLDQGTRLLLSSQTGAGPSGTAGQKAAPAPDASKASGPRKDSPEAKQ